jgi:hypothetical protein
MVQRTIGASVPHNLAEDATDALAISLCHLFRAKMPTKTPIKMPIKSPRLPAVSKALPRRPVRPIVLAGAKP